MQWLATVNSMALKPKALLLLWLALAPLAAAADSMFCCQESPGGRKHCADALPEACRGRAYRVLDGQGNLLREVPPPLTPAQKAAKAEAEREQAARDEAAREQTRKDAALLATYSSLQDIEAAQQKAESTARLNLQGAQARLDELRKRQRSLSGAPASEAQQQRARQLDSELASLRQEIEQKQAELTNLAPRYANERQRFRELTSR